MAAKHEIDFDFDALEGAFYRDCANAFTGLQLDYPDDPFYAYALYVPEDMGYVGILAYTEGRLEAEAKEYLHSQIPADSEVNIEDVRDYWRHTCAGDDHQKLLDATSDLLGQLLLKCDALYDYYELELNVGWESADKIIRSLQERILAICERVMIRLDEAKVFELNNQRHNVTLMIRHGDRNPELATVKRLNPEAVYKRYIVEWEAYKAAFTAIHGRVPDWSE
jgi:hypothetical protein